MSASRIQVLVHKAAALLVAASMLSLAACDKKVDEWHNTTVFDPKKVEDAIAQYYLVYKASGSQYGRLTPGNKAEIARAIGEKVALLNARQYNDILGHLAADYHHHPENREAIESILSAVYVAVAPELIEDSNRHPVRTVVSDVFTVFFAGYVFGFGKGAYKWATRGRGFKSMFRFRRVARYVAVNLPRSRKERLAMLGLGTAAGVAHAVVEATETRKLDPRDLLTSARAGSSDPAILSMVIREMQELMALRRDQLNAREASDILAHPDFCLSEEEKTSVEPGQAPLGPMGCIDRIRDEVQSVKTQVRHIYETYPDFRSELETLAMDIRDSEARMDALSPQLEAHLPDEQRLDLDSLDEALE